MNSSGILGSKSGETRRNAGLGIFGYSHEECCTLVCLHVPWPLTSGFPSQQPHVALFTLGGERGECSLPDSAPVIPGWRESKIVVQSIKQSLLAEGVHLSILLFSQ